MNRRRRAYSAGVRHSGPARSRRDAAGGGTCRNPNVGRTTTVDFRSSDADVKRLTTDVPVAARTDAVRRTHASAWAVCRTPGGLRARSRANVVLPARELRGNSAASREINRGAETRARGGRRQRRPLSRGPR